MKLRSTAIFGFTSAICDLALLIALGYRSDVHYRGDASFLAFLASAIAFYSFAKVLDRKWQLP